MPRKEPKHQKYQEYNERERKQSQISIPLLEKRLKLQWKMTLTKYRLKQKSLLKRYCHNRIAPTATACQRVMLSIADRSNRMHTKSRRDSLRECDSSCSEEK